MSDYLKPAPSGEEWPLLTKLAFEKQSLGMYVSGHPLDLVDAWLARYRDFDLVSFEDTDPGTFVKVAGIVAEFTEIVTKKGPKMARFELEDLTGRAPVVIFTKAYAEVAHVLGEGAIVFAECRIDTDDRDAKQMYVSELKAFDLAKFVADHNGKTQTVTPVSVKGGFGLLLDGGDR